MRAGKPRMWENRQGEGAPMPPSTTSLPSERVQDDMTMSQCEAASVEESPRRKARPGKRQRPPNDSPTSSSSCLDKALDTNIHNLEGENQRLQGQNAQLRAALAAICAQAHGAEEENRRLARLISLLAPNKGAFQLRPELSSTASSMERALSAANGEPEEGGQSTAGAKSGIADTETVQAEATAAAALAINQGNPAAALIDLLLLATKKREVERRQARS